MSITPHPVPPARNHRAKGTRFLSEAHAINAVEGCAFAEKIGRPLNHAAAIHFDAGGATGRAQDVVGHYLRMAGQWLADRGEQSTYIWFLEHRKNDPEKGLHVHLLFYVPRSLGDQFRKLARDGWARQAGINPKPGVVHIQAVGSKGGQRYYYPEHADTPDARDKRMAAIKGKLRYILKGQDPTAPGLIISDDGATPASALLKVRTEENEIIYGRRVSLSRNIGATARQRWRDSRLASLPAHPIG